MVNSSQTRNWFNARVSLTASHPGLDSLASYFLHKFAHLVQQQICTHADQVRSKRVEVNLVVVVGGVKAYQTEFQKELTFFQKKAFLELISPWCR